MLHANEVPMLMCCFGTLRLGQFSVQMDMSALLVVKMPFVLGFNGASVDRRTSKVHQIDSWTVAMKLAKNWGEK